jgi:cystathionine gamma-synthase
MTDDVKTNRQTIAVWGGETDEIWWKNSTQVPLVQSVSFGYQDVDHWQAVALEQEPGFIYSRNANPTVQVFEEKMCALEGAEAALAFPTGMAAISNTLFELLAPGERIVVIKDSYGGTSKICIEFLPKWNVEVQFCDTTDHDQIEAEVAKGCRVLYLESPTNPTVKIVDIGRLARAAHAVGAVVVVDNTFATPINQQPLALGADLVLHSATKFLGGHADALGGVVCGSSDLIHRIYHHREINGASLAPEIAYRLLRSVKTLGIRVERQNASAMRIAEFLSDHPVVEKVFYPGLPGHEHHDVAVRQMSGFGGMLSFMVAGGLDAVKKVLPRIRYAHRAANLGAVETIVGTPATTSHVECTAEERTQLGIPEGLIRYSTGIEHPDDLIADLDQALSVLA